MIGLYLNKIQNKETLSTDEAYGFIECMHEGRCSDEQAAMILFAIHARGETIDELRGFREYLSSQSKPIELPDGRGVIDICGTGGDGKGVFNVSTAAALVIAACGVPVLKHGGRAVSSSSGSVDVLSELGIDSVVGSEQALRSLRDHNCGFLMAGAFNKAYADLAPLRKSMSARTVLNILGPLLNPAKPQYQVVGIYSKDLLMPVAELLRDSSVKEAIVVHSNDGMDEFSICDKSTFIHLKDNQLQVNEIHPADVGLSVASLEDIQGGSPKENAQIIMSILEGSKDPHRDIVVLNAAVALCLYGVVDSIKLGVQKAQDVIDSSEALKLLKKMKG